MSNPDGTSQDTGSSSGLNEHQAAERIAQLLSGDGDSDEGETQEEQSSEQAEDDEAEASEDTADESEDEADPSDDAEEQPEPTAYTVKIDGQEVQVTLDEALKGYQRAQDYTRKTMDLAEQRKAVDAERASLAPERDAYRQGLARLEAFIASNAQPDADLDQLRHTDPSEWAARMLEQQQRQQQLSALKAEQARLDGETQREQAEQQTRQRAEHLAAEEAKLISAIPTWANADTRKAETQQIADYAQSLGVTPEELGELADSRLVIALREGAKYRALQAKKPAVQARIEAVKTAKPGSAAVQPSKVTQATRAKQRLAKTGSVDDAARALEHLL